MTQPAPVSAEKNAAPPTEVKDGKMTRPAPILVEIVVAASRLILLVMVVAAALLTWLVDGSPLVAVLRAGLTLAVLSGLLWPLNYLLAEGVLNARVIEVKAGRANAAPPPQPTVELEA
jgi:hypothetical protein